MASSSSIQALISQLEDFHENFEKAVKTAADEAADIALEKAIKEFMEPIRENFDKYVDDFYNSYSPRVYQRRFSMHEIYKPEINKLGEKKLELVINYEDGEMTFRGGGTGLLELTFGQGFHGGAAGTDHNGTTVSYPFTRAPVDRWWQWNHAAMKSDSPYEQFQEWFDSYWSGGGFQGIFEKHFNNEFEKALSYNLVF